MLADKTIIDFWYKEPDKMLQHQIDKIINIDQLAVLKPIGESLRRIMEGGNFIVYNDISNSLTSALGVTYKLNVR